MDARQFMPAIDLGYINRSVLFVNYYFDAVDFLWHSGISLAKFRLDPLIAHVVVVDWITVRYSANREVVFSSKHCLSINYKTTI